MAIGAVGGVGLSQLAELYRQQVISGGSSTDGTGAASAATAPQRAAQTRGTDFASAIGNSIGQVEQLDKNAAGKAVQAATGDLNDVHDYVLAANQAQLATELTTTVRNKALESFNEIMRMPL